VPVMLRVLARPPVESSEVADDKRQERARRYWGVRARPSGGRASPVHLEAAPRAGAVAINRVAPAPTSCHWWRCSRRRHGHRLASDWSPRDGDGKGAYSGRPGPAQLTRDGKLSGSSRSTTCPPTRGLPWPWISWRVGAVGVPLEAGVAGGGPEGWPESQGSSLRYARVRSSQNPPNGSSLLCLPRYSWCPSAGGGWDGRAAAIAARVRGVVPR